MEKFFFDHVSVLPMDVKNSISKRFRNINMILFVIIAIIIFITMFTILRGITSNVSKDYARLYADNTVSIMNTYLNSEIALMRKTAQSNAMIEWFVDEENDEKKQNAYNEMMGTIGVSSGKNLYLGIAKTLNEFTVKENHTINDIQHHATLSEQGPNDNWYFECLADSKEYLLNVDIDKIYHSKSVWLNYKVSRDGIDYGVICTALAFSQVVEDLFSQYESNGVRCLIIDEKGDIQMDSALFGDTEFLNTLDTYNILDGVDGVSNTTFLNAVKQYVKPMDSYHDSNSAMTVLELGDRRYHYATIAPIPSTTWTVVTLFNSSALFGIDKLAPVFIIILITFIIFTLLINGTLSKLMIKPLNSLVQSIEQVKHNYDEPIYGLERHDEIGVLANTIQNMKDSLIVAVSKVHYDALTNIYNRRYYDENMSRLIDNLSKNNGNLSILLLDIDHFKEYNDTYGHAAGDECLKKAAIILTECISRREDFVARYGGEEFVVVLPHTSCENACIVAQRIVDAFKKAAIPHNSSHVVDYITVSIGMISSVVQSNDTAEMYIQRADKALYLSKENGRNQYTIYKG